MRCQAGQLPIHTVPIKPHRGSLLVFMCVHSFTSNKQLLFLNQKRREKYEGGNLGSLHFKWTSSRHSFCVRLYPSADQAPSL